MLTVSEVADRLRVSPSTVYSLVESGVLECHRIGLGRGTIRVSEEQLQQFLQQSKVGRTEASPIALRDIRFGGRE